MNIISEDRFKQLTSLIEKIPPILVAGDIGLDKYTFGEVDRISPEAPVPVIRVTKEWHKLGLAANIGHNLQTLGVRSTLCGVIGEDKNGNLFENLLEDNGLKTWGVVRCDDRPTTFKERVTTKIQQICRIDYESESPISDNMEKKLLDRLFDLSHDHSGLILEDYGKGTLTPKVLREVIDRFSTEGVFIAVDPGRTTPPHYYKGATLLKPNLKEALLMAEALGHRDHNLESIAELLVEKLKIKKLVITLGPEGMALLDTEGPGHLTIIPTVATNVYDVSGAGDTAISILTSSLLAGATLEEAAWMANCASGVVVGKKGTSTVDQVELLDFHKKLLMTLS